MVRYIRGDKMDSKNLQGDNSTLRIEKEDSRKRNDWVWYKYRLLEVEHLENFT